MLKEQDNCDATKINVGISSNEFYPHENIPKKLLALRKNCKIIVLSLLSENERRGSIYFVQAAKELLRSTKDIGFVFTQRSENQFFDFTDERLLNLELLPRDKMPQYFSGCDVIVDSSLFHGFGLPGLEGMSCGLAGILTNVELDYAKNGENCILVEPKNVNAIKNAIIKLRDNKELLTKNKKSAREAAKNFDWKKIIPEYEEYFNKIISNFDEEKLRPK